MAGLKAIEKIGSLDRRLKIYTLQTDRNGVGEEIKTAKLLLEVWAKKEDQRKGSKEEDQANRITEFRKTIWIIRYPEENITAKMIVEDEDKNQYDIETVRELSRKRFLELTTIFRE